MTQATKPPAFLCYATDWLASTITMTLEAQGAYMRLLCWQWDKGGLPADERQLALQIVGISQYRWRAKWQAIWMQIACKFAQDPDGQLRNPRLERVREELSTYKAVRSKGGKARAAAADRKQGKFRLYGSDQGAPAGDQPPSPSPSPSPVRTERQRPDGRDTPRDDPHGGGDDDLIALARAPAADGNYAVLVRLAHTVMDECDISDPTSPDLTDLFKTACAQRRIGYEPEVFHRALRSAATQRGRPREDRHGPLAPMAAELQRAMRAGTLPMAVMSMTPMRPRQRR